MKKVKLKIGDKISVKWYDAHGKSSWHTYNEVQHTLKDHAVIETLGFYAGKSNNYIAVSQGYYKSDENDMAPFCQIEFVPTGSIKAITKLP
jgi:hypothetical protein